MEDSFRLRVDKIFGSLSSSATPTPSLSSLWSLTDDELDKNEWNRDKGSPEREPEQGTDDFSLNQGKGFRKRSIGYSGDLEDDLEVLDEDDIDFEDEQKSPNSSKPSSKPDDLDDEEWEIKCSIGLDCTLDNEEEEDGYDKVAIGKDKKNDDRVYLRDLTDDGVHIDSCNVLPISFRDATRDPRANHIAAINRLKEDSEAASKVVSFNVSEKDETSDAKTSEDGNLKSILKRKDIPLDSKLQKRVRFDPECLNDTNEDSEGSKDIQMNSCATEIEVSNGTSVSSHHLGVPDYIRNPSKYTHYTFDSSTDIDEESNRLAYADFLKLIKGSNNMELDQDDESMDIPKSVTFIPRRKTGDSTMVENCTEPKQNKYDLPNENNKRGVPIGIAARDVEDVGVCEMEEDGLETEASRKSHSHRASRQYRTKDRLELEDNN